MTRAQAQAAAAQLVANGYSVMVQLVDNTDDRWTIQTTVDEYVPEVTVQQFATQEGVTVGNYRTSTTVMFN